MGLLKNTKATDYQTISGLNVLRFKENLPCGERGIRTPGGLTLNGFQDRRNRPLCHLSGAKIVQKLVAKMHAYRFT